VRSADVEVIDANKSGQKATWQKGKTDASGCFSLAVSDTSTRTIYVRARHHLHPDHGAGDQGGRPGGSVYALRSANLANHGPNTNVNFGTWWPRWERR
jgi:hypothetical protein